MCQATLHTLRGVLLKALLGTVVFLDACGCSQLLTPPPPTPTPEPTSTPTPEPTPTPTPIPIPLGTGPLSGKGSELVDAGGREVRLTGVNWSGLETGAYTPNGLLNRDLDTILDQMVSLGFNSIRLPFSNQALDPSSKPNSINYQLNPTLQGLNGLELMDQIVDRARAHGLRVILDRPRLSADEQADLWYSGRISEERWIKDWVMLATHYRGNPAVVGADLYNEPHGSATWGTDNPSTDWRLAAERAGNAILEANPDWLIIVEGIQYVGHDQYWWGGNLSAAGDAPVRLTHPERLVYSAHDYGAGISWQPWFSGPDWVAGLPSVWRAHWAYLQEDGIAPVLVGEYGGRSVGQDPEGLWQRALIAFLQDGGYSNLYWVWNPDGWTGGILLDEGGRVDRAKVDLLAPGQSPLLGGLD